MLGHIYLQLEVGERMNTVQGMKIVQTSQRQK